MEAGVEETAVPQTLISVGLNDFPEVQFAAGGGRVPFISSPLDAFLGSATGAELSHLRPCYQGGW